MKLKLNDGVAIAICIMVVLVAQAADTSSPLGGSWHVNNWMAGSDRVQLELSRSTLTSRWVIGSDYPLNELRGLTRDELHSLHANVHFEFARDAGALVCEGSLVAGVGGGKFQFSPSQAFVDEMRRLGYDGLSEKTLFEMMMQDVNLVFVRAVRKAGLRDVDAGKLIGLRNHGITPDYIAEIHSAGYDFSADDLMSLKNHGVSTELLREAKRAGYNFDSDQVVKLQTHGIDSDYIRGLRVARYELSADDMVNLKIHGVDPDFVRDLQAAHYKLSPDEIVNLRIHGITSEFTSEVKRTGYDLSVDELTNLQNNGVAAEFLGDLHKAGYGRLPVDQIVRMWQNGVRGDYIARISATFGANGTPRLTPDQIIKLKVHGVD